ncbi:unnamed protein product [Symbiodinium pilosum]|uniref:Uncharacterized protein n=1 Tax=Symbiodinium pilosum TaxID=2952 RepID=A0A812MRG6_SYMPI|nr:unnamed protein product [Symbiodinium pilosum]
MNLAGKLKRSIAAEQGRLEMRRRLNAPTSNTGPGLGLTSRAVTCQVMLLRGSSSDFHKIAPSSEDPLTNPLTGATPFFHFREPDCVTTWLRGPGSQAQDDTLARHLAIQLKRLKAFVSFSSCFRLLSHCALTLLQVVEFMRTLLRRNPEALRNYRFEDVNLSSAFIVAWVTMVGPGLMEWHPVPKLLNHVDNGARKSWIDSPFNF